MAKVRQATKLKHQSNLGEGVEEVAFEAGEEVTVLKEWETGYLIKNTKGQLFNVPKDQIER
jgi:hypothetical protein